MKKLVLLPLLMLCLGVWAAECDDLTGKPYAKCIEDEAVKSHSDLNQTFKTALSETPLYSKSSFSNAQKAWQQYRNAECEYQVSLNSTASDAPIDSPIEMAQCLIDLNKKRSIDLRGD